MPTERRERIRSRPSWIVPGLLLAWAAALLLTGVLRAAEPWAVVCLVAAGLTVLATVLGLVLWTWMEGLYGSLIVASGGLIAAGGALSSVTTIALGVVALVCVGARAPIAWSLRDVGRGAGPAASPPADAQKTWRDMLARLHETSMLSDNAKRVLFREREIQLLHDAISEDVEQGQYNAALTLCDALSTLYGQREEAEEHRARIMHARHERYEAQVDSASRAFDALLAERDWSRVYEEAARLRRLYPESLLVAGLDQRITQARDEHKRDLERRFLVAAETGDSEVAMGLLRELDRYITPEEAERLSEVAQGVITRHRELLGARFRIAVSERRWAEAAQAGGAIMSEFPNSKMAIEVSSMIEIIRTRATEAAMVAERG